MKSELAEALAALPEDVREPARAHDVLPTVTAAGPPPSSAVRRLALLGSTSARIALGYAALGLKRITGRAEAGESAHRDAAIRLLGSMGYLRGAAMKVGQFLAQVPELTSEDFAESLERLCFDAPPMHFALLREHARRQLGRGVDEAFASFDEQAAAAASLGQVHRATLEDGRAVAVKIQYPGMGRAIRADLRTLRTLMATMRFSPQHASIKRQLDVLTDMLLQETDYRHEARMMRAVGDLLHEEDGIVVPRPLEGLSNERLLTMDWLEGRHPSAFLASGPSEDQARRVAEAIWTFVVRAFYTGRITYNDPGPGNFLVLEDGRLGVVDFGCTHRYSDAEWDIVERMDRAMLEGGEAVRNAVTEMVDLDPSRPWDREYLDRVVEIVEWFREPIDADGPFNFAAGDYLARGMELFADAGRRRYFRNCPSSMWSQRLLIGVRALLARFDVAIDTGGIWERETGLPRRIR